MFGYWQRFDNGLLYIVRSSDMTCDDPKGVARSSDTAGFELRMTICMHEVVQICSLSHVSVPCLPSHVPCFRLCF
jgi:hypothetical protein